MIFIHMFKIIIQSGRTIDQKMSPMIINITQIYYFFVQIFNFIIINGVSFSQINFFFILRCDRNCIFCIRIHFRCFHIIFFRIKHSSTTKQTVFCKSIWQKIPLFHLCCIQFLPAWQLSLCQFLITLCIIRV